MEYCRADTPDSFENRNNTHFFWTYVSLKHKTLISGYYGKNTKHRIRCFWELWLLSQKVHINLFIKVKNVGGEGQSSPKKHPTIMHVDCKQQNTRKCLYMMMKIKNDEGANCNAICFFKLGNIFTPKADFFEKTTFEKSLVWLVLSLSLWRHILLHAWHSNGLARVRNSCWGG